MKIIVVTSTEIQNNFEKYLSIAMSGQEVIITKNSMEVANVIKLMALDDKKQIRYLLK